MTTVLQALPLLFAEGRARQESPHLAIPASRECAGCPRNLALIEPDPGLAGAPNGRLEELNSRVRLIRHRSFGFHSAAPWSRSSISAARTHGHAPPWLIFSLERVEPPFP